jgi:hypothetical protein
VRARLYLAAAFLFATSLNAQTTGQVYTSNPPSGHSEDGVLIVSTTAGAPDIGAKLGAATALAGFTVFDSADLPLFTVTGAGKVGMGTLTPAEQFHIVKTGTGITRIRVENDNTLAGSALWLTDASTVRGEIASYGSTNTSRPNQLVIANKTGGQMTLMQYDPATSTTVDAVRILANGRMAVGGSSAPVHRLQVTSSTDGEVPLYGVVNSIIETSVSQTDVGAVGYSYQNVQTGATNSAYASGVRARGALNGAGTLNDAYGILADSGISSMSGMVVEAHGVFSTVYKAEGTTGSIGTGYGLRIGAMNATTVVGVKVDGAAMNATTGYGIKIDDLNNTTVGTAWGIHQAGDNDANFLNGAVQIGSVSTVPNYTYPVEKLHVYGSAKFEGTVTGGNISAKYQDVAEWVPSTTDLAPGTVVVLNPGKNNEVMMSGTAYDTMVAGVVSAQPGLILGEGGEGMEQVATTGRVRVRVDASRGPIKVGDLLVTSNLPGTAMKSEPMQLSGRNFHQPGTIIGKALEPLAGGTGEILVLLSMQ